MRALSDSRTEPTYPCLRVPAAPASITASRLPGPFVSVECHFGIAEGTAAGLAAGFFRVRSWRTPPNWSILDWREELGALAIMAAWQAEQDYDPSCGVPLGGFVFCRVKAAAFTRYRQEWRFFLRIAPVDQETIETLSGSDPAAHSAQPECESLREALNRLSQSELRLLDQLFWQECTEASIAAEQRISQPAVNKRKRVTLEHVRTLLGGE
jgi:DNA-directed RNA polymerase specialized sigma24 family protein